MKKAIAGVAVLLWCIGMAWAQEEAVVIDGICARVNQDIITVSAFRRAQRDLRLEVENQFQGQPERIEQEYRTAVKELLQNLIDTQLLVQKADEMGINVEAQINEFLINMAEQNNFPPSKIDEMLQQMGFDPAQARQMLRMRFQRQAVIGREVWQNVAQNVFDQDIEAFYRQRIGEYTEPGGVKLSEIHLHLDGRSRDEATALAWQLIAQIRGGADFAELARKHSNGPTASNGGDLGWFNLDPEPELGEKQRQAIAGQQVGEVTDPIDLADGIRIFRIDDRRERKEKPLTPELRREIAMRVAQDRLDPAIDQYVEQLRQNAYIEILGSCKAEIGQPANNGGRARAPEGQREPEGHSTAP